MDSSYGRILSINSIDNQPLLQEQAIAYLEDNGFVLFGAKSTEEGLALFRKEKPDLVLSDSGLELLEAINKESPETPVIMLSDQKAISGAVSALNLGAWDYIIKPIVDLTVLERSICKALERARLVKENRVYRAALESANESLSQNLRTLEVDQEAGKQVQMQLLPPSTCHFGAYNIQYKILPSLYLSGDFVDYFKINERLVGFYIADVSGHGASSAFVTVMLKSLVTQMMASSIIEHPAKVLKTLSDAMAKAKLGKYLTMIYGVLDTKSNTLVYSVGGHYPSPILYDGSTARYLEGEGFAVGIFDKAEYEEYSLALPQTFSLSMYSDGILEILPGKKLEDSEQILLDKASSLNLSAEGVFESFGIQESDEKTHLPDDIAFLVINKK